jgi:hypothetical protein
LKVEPGSVRRRSRNSLGMETPFRVAFRHFSDEKLYKAQDRLAPGKFSFQRMAGPNMMKLS